MQHLRSTAILIVALTAAVDAAEPSAKVTFQEDVLAIFRESCCACHSQDDAASGLALDGYDAALGGGAGGEVLAAGDPEESRLWRLVTHQESPKMPPGEKLPDDQLAVIKRWIEGGLLDNAGSKPKKPKRSGIGEVAVTTDSRPQGEPAMPTGWFREPVVTADRVGPITTLATSPWAPLAAVPWQRQVSLYRTDTLELAGVLPYPKGAPRVVRFSRDGSLLLVAGGRGASFGSAAVFDVKTGARLVTVGEELDEVLAADISPNQALVAIGGPKKKVRVYRTSDGSLAYELGKHTDWITALQFSPDGKLLATADRSAGLLLWQAPSGNPRGDLRGHKQAITSIDWRADAAALASASEDGEVRLWRPDGQPIKNFAAHAGGVTSVAFASDGKLATAGRDRKAATWSADGKPLKQYGPLNEIALGVSFTHDDKRLVVSDFAGDVKLFDVASGKVVSEMKPNPPTIATRLAQARAARAALKPKLNGAETRQKRAAEKLTAAKSAHEAFDKRMAEARSDVDGAKGRLAAAERAKQLSQTASDAAEKALTAAQGVRRAAEEALAVAEKGLAEVSSDEEESPGAIVQSLVLAVKHAKEGQQKQAQVKGDAQAALDRTAASLKLASVAKEKAERAFAGVTSERAKLPDLAAEEAAAQTAIGDIEKFRREAGALDELIAAVELELQTFHNAQAKFAAEAEAQEEVRERVAAAATEAQQAVAAARLAEQQAQAAVDAVAKKIAVLQQQLAQDQQVREQAQGEVARLSKEAETRAGELSEAELAAARAESRQADFAAAEEARKVYLQATP